jgi:hypothetical protein
MAVTWTGHKSLNQIALANGAYGALVASLCKFACIPVKVKGSTRFVEEMFVDIIANMICEWQSHNAIHRKVRECGPPRGRRKRKPRP